MTRRIWLGAALSGVALTASRADAAAGLVSAPAVRARLSLNENPFGPSPHAVDAIRHGLDRMYRYTDAEALTRAAAAREAISADQIVLGEILEALGFQLARSGPPGGEFIYSEPGYTALVDAVAPGGGVVVGVPLDANLQNDLPALAARVRSQTRAIYLVNPHNPSGTVSDATTFTLFVRDLSRHATVIVDEAYLEFAPDFAQRTVVSLTRAGENVVVFRTFDKAFGLAGLPMGYAVVPKPLAASLRAAGIGAAESLNRLAVIAAAASLGDADYIPAMRTKVADERAIWHRLLDRLKLRRSDSRGNFVFFETSRPHRDFAGDMAKRGIDIGRAFPPLDDWARISIGLPEENHLARAAAADIFK